MRLNEIILPQKKCSGIKDNQMLLLWFKKIFDLLYLERGFVVRAHFMDVGASKI